ncbi:expressed unknown protein [Seminavis robusta]|uniref:Ubiquitin-like domain-containing protein n=1 Tax=Seminavis robusta TaxID=568900 RepID=A0A9N8EC67_9STRA|nr:expressed unknown protein [Seminavis robusta]|eukprot:Sro876_g214490.1 n/a (862) ;mRNA; r:9801-12386
MKFPRKKLGMDWWWNARRRRPKEEEASENNSGTEPKNSNATVGILLQDYSSVTTTACGTAERYLRYCASDAREEYWKTFWDEKLPKDAQFRLLQVHFLRKDGQRMTAAIPVCACMTVGDLLRGVQRIPSFSGSTFQKGHLFFVINGWRVLHLPDGWNSEAISTEQLFNTLNQDIGSLHVLQGISPGATTEPEPFMGVFPYRYRVSEISVLLIHCIIVIPLKLLSRHNKVDSFKCNVENPTEGETGKIDSNEYVSLEVALAPYDTVDGMKRLIERKTGLPMKIQRLAHGDAELHGFVRLREVMPNVCERTFQPLLKVMDSPYAFVVRTLSGETMPWYRTASTITLFELKQTIARKTKIPVETQFLMFRGRELTVEDQIADCDIQEGSVVHCMAIPEGRQSIDLMYKEFCPFPIPLAENRAISLSQLKRLAATIIQCCETERWTSTDPKSKGAHPLRPEDVTFYDLLHHYIRPLTKPYKCSYVELVAEIEQVSTWYVSHSWQAPVLDFVACLEQHAYDYNLDEESAFYWVSACALRQNDLDTEISDYAPVQDSPFYNAMNRAKKIVSILDDEGIAYKRIWCTFEIFVALSQHTYDSYALTLDDTETRRAVGLRGSRRHDYRYNYNHYLQNYYRIRFPLHLCLKALEVRLEEAEASREFDRRRILHHIVGNHGEKSSSEDPPRQHQKYDELNALLNENFAVSAIRGAALAGAGKGVLNTIRTSLGASNVTELHLSFEGCFEFQARHFAMALPHTLDHLSLDFSRIPFTTSHEFAIGLGRLQNLRTLSIKCVFCDNLICANALWKELGALSNLEVLHLDFNGCKRLDSFSELRLEKAMTRLTKLRGYTFLFKVQDDSSDYFARGI